MSPRFITKKVHSYLDYPVVLSLIGLPFLLKLGDSSPLALWLSVGSGIAALVLTLLTDHQLGVIRVLSYRLHLTVDFLVAAIFLAAPFIVKFSSIDAWYYWLNGAALMLVVRLHRPEPAVPFLVRAPISN